MDRPQTIAFVCLHGSAKSLIAAEYLTRLAKKRGIGVVGTTSGPEPDAEVPENVVAGMHTRGFDVQHLKPHMLTAERLQNASRIVSFGYDVSALNKSGAPVEQWADCPAVSDDFDVAWDFITRRVEALLDKFAAK